jgi:hypothetical protein
MEIINKLLIDSLNGFAVNDIPLFFFQLLTAGLFAHLFQLLINKKWKNNIISNAALISTSVALIASMVKYSLPFAVLALAVLIWFKPNKDETLISKITLLITGIIGVGCGVGSVFQTGLGIIVIMFIILMTPIKTKS